MLKSSWNLRTTYSVLNKIEKLLLERHENEDKINFEESNWNLKKVINFNVKKKSTRIFVHI